MKIVCGSCQAKYSIADEKVQGKVFKIRCKRCSEVIVVRGDEQGGQEAAAATPAYDAAADAIWHVVISGEQAGPYAPSQLAEMLTAGHVDWEAYVWCEGFDNWSAMRDVPDLVAAITGQGEAQQHGGGAAEQGYAAQPSMGADPFADDGGGGSGGGGGLFAEPAAPASRGNLFGGGQDNSPFDGGGQVVASAPSPRVSVEQAMTGARNENSVLFSLKNLQALATGSSGAPGSSPSASSIGMGGLGGGMGGGMGPGNRPGFAGGEGSGLIDIRALATATGVGDTSRGADEKDALLSLGSAQTGAFGALGSPMLAPAGADDDSSKKGLMLAVFGGFALLAIAGVAIAVILKPQAPTQAPITAPAAPPPMAAAAAAVNPAPAAAPAPTEAPTEGELAARKAAAAAAGNEKPSSGASRSTGGSKHHESAGSEKPSSGGGQTVAAKSEPSTPREDKPSKAKGGSSSIDDLLDGAIGGGSSSKPSKHEAAAPAPSNLPEKPSREDVLAAMNGVKDDVKACGKGQTGVAFANINVAGKTGRVTSAEITGITGEPGSCIARVVRKASFPKFQSDSFQVKFPFKL